MLFKKCFVNIFLMVFLGFSLVKAQVEVPPPLGFVEYDDRLTSYQVYDFETQKTELIQRSAPPDESRFHSYSLDKQFDLRSPIDPSVHFLVVQSEPDLHHGSIMPATIWKWFSENGREFIADNITIFPSLNQIFTWSPNGKYLYFLKDWQTDRTFSLYQLNLSTSHLELIQKSVLILTRCSSDTLLCLVDTLQVNGSRNLQLIDLNTGSQTEIGAALFVGSVHWIDEGKKFLYLQMVGDKCCAVREYDVFEGASRLVSEIDVPNVDELIWSPDEHWLAVQSTLDFNLFSQMFVFDLQSKGSSPILTAKHTIRFNLHDEDDGIRWMDSDTLFYVTYEQETGYNFHRINFSNNEDLILTQIPSRHSFFDHGWSLDEKWIAFSEFVAEGNVATIHIISTQNAGSEIKLTFPIKNHYMCVGWATPTTYAEGTANVCDVSVGVG